MSPLEFLVSKVPRWLREGGPALPPSCSSSRVTSPLTGAVARLVAPSWKYRATEIRSAGRSGAVPQGLATVLVSEIRSRMLLAVLRAYVVVVHSSSPDFAVSPREDSVRT